MSDRSINQPPAKRLRKEETIPSLDDLRDKLYNDPDLNDGLNGKTRKWGCAGEEEAMEDEGEEGEGEGTGMHAEIGATEQGVAPHVEGEGTGMHVVVGAGEEEAMEEEQEEVCQEDLDLAASLSATAIATAIAASEPREQDDPMASVTFADGYKVVLFNSQRYPNLIGTRAEPTPQSLLLLGASCAVGKSTVVRTLFEEKFFVEKPTARGLFLAANQTYAQNLTQELRATFPNCSAQCYLDTDKTQPMHAQLVVCTLESMHRLKDDHFDVVFIDEIRSIAGVVGGATLPLSSSRYHTFRRVAARATYLLAADAHVRIDGCVKDFCADNFPNRKPVLALLSQPPPEHLHRRAVCLYGEAGKDPWFASLRVACSAWRADHSKRFAVAVGSKGQVSKVCLVLEEYGVPHEAYTGDTGDDIKFSHLKDPDTHWELLGAVVFTTTISVGVDPKRVKFAKVFMWTHRGGCNPRQMAQGAMRFARSSLAPLEDTDVLVLVDALSPEQRAQRVAAKKAKPLVPFSEYERLRDSQDPNEREQSNRVTVAASFDFELKELQKGRGRTNQRVLEESFVSGDPGAWANEIPDSTLRVWAWNKLEEKRKMAEHDNLVREVFLATGWTVAIGGAGEEPNGTNGAPDDDEEGYGLHTTMTQIGRWRYGYQRIQERGEEGFFDNCFGLWKVESGTMPERTDEEKLLIDMYAVSRHLDYLPPLEDLEELIKSQRAPEEDDDKRTAKGMLQLKRYADGLMLRATSLCRTIEDQFKADAGDRTFHETQLLRPTAQQQASLGHRMLLQKKAAKLLGDESGRLLIDGGNLSQSWIEWVNAKDLRSDKLKGVAQYARDLTVGDAGKLSAPKMVLDKLGKACGLKAHFEETQPRTASGKRPRVVTAIEFRPLVPRLIDDWLVYSPDLGLKVRVGHWEEEHHDMDPDGHDILAAADLLSVDKKPFDPSSGLRHVERLDAAALANQLERGRKLRKRVDPQAVRTSKLVDRWDRTLTWLEAADESATAADANGHRFLHVSYGRRGPMGRKIASWPSLQNCPRTLRGPLCGGNDPWYRDFDVWNCHPPMLVQDYVRSRGLLGPAALARTAPLWGRYTSSKQERDAILWEIVDHYRCPFKAAKACVLRVFNGGSVEKWVAEEGLDTSAHILPMLEDLAEQATGLRNFYLTDKYADKVPELRQWARQSDPKASKVKIDRKAFAYLLQERERRVLDCIVASLERSGWSVPTLIFDGGLVDLSSNQGGDLSADLRLAEAAVLEKLNYTIVLVDEPL